MGNQNEQSEKRLQQIEKKEEKTGGAEPQVISSAILNDGALVEMLYDKKQGETSFAVCKDGDIEIKRVISMDDVVLVPHAPTKALVSTGVVLFPSEPKEYGSQRELVEDVQKFIRKYLSVSPFFEKIASYYVLFSWIHDDFNELPYLRGLGDYGTGKSRLLQVIGSVCYMSIFASGATTVSPIFRILNDFNGTLVLDEADFKLSDTTAEIIKILNNGYMKGMSVLRSEANSKKSYDVKAFKVFGPKIIATRHLFKDSALESRMITEDMNLNLPNDNIPFNIPEGFWEEALELRNKLLMFRFREKGSSKLKTELVDRTIEPRLNQIALPLMSIVDDEALVSEIRQHIREYNDKIKTDRTLGYNYQILDAICRLQDRGYDQPSVQEITKEFNEGLTYSEALTAKKMGFLLNKTLDLKTERTRFGYILSKDNNRKIETLKKRYGIEQPKDVNIVNDVNNSEQEQNKDLTLLL